MATSDICEKIVNANNIKCKNMITVRINGGTVPTGGCKHISNSTDNDLHTEMETKYTTRFSGTPS